MLNKLIFKIQVILFLALILIISNSFGKMPKENQGIFEKNSQFSTNESPCIEHRVHDTGNIQLVINNTGEIGSNINPETYNYPINYFPKEGESNFLYGAGYWIGAVVGDDTVVSVGMNGWNFTREMWPEKCPNGEIVSENTVSHQDYIAKFTDTLADPTFVQYDPWDGRPHIPLNLKITQKSYAWDVPLAEDFVIFDLQVENIGIEDLNEVWVGIFVDGDIFARFNDGLSTGCTDDIAGFLNTTSSLSGCGQDTLNLAWMADNDGIGDYVNSKCELTSVTGIRLLSTVSDSLTINYNWWVSNSTAALDWGPRQTGTPEDPFRDFGLFLGTPEGDKNKYYIMSHPEIDYDQLFTFTDNTADGWLPPPAIGADIADGYDTRYLLSFGPFDIDAGETLPFVFTFVGGENFHTNNCENFDNLFDPMNPQPFYDQLNFSDFTKNAMMAEWVYDNPGIDTDGDGYFGKYRICRNDTVFYQGDGVPDYNPYFICGDIDADGTMNLKDILSLIGYLFYNKPEPPGLSNADFDENGRFGLMDIIYLINYIYRGGDNLNCMLLNK